MSKRMMVAELIGIVLVEMKSARFEPSTVKQYSKILDRLQKTAQELGKVYFDDQLAEAFSADSYNRHTGEYCHSRFLYHQRCVFLLRSFQNDGRIEWSKLLRPPKDMPHTIIFQGILEQYSARLGEYGLEKNTRESYQNIACKFLRFCEGKGYTELEEVQRKDIPAFMQALRSTWASGSLRTGASALRSFFHVFPTLAHLEAIVPKHLPVKHDIIPVFTEEGQTAFRETVKGPSVRKRDAAICLLSLETGLRAVDILNIRLSSIDWSNDCIHIIQQKTDAPLDIPLLSSYGNAIAEYILHERPASGSDFLFLRSSAPFDPLTGHAACWHIIAKVIENAGLAETTAYCGTRFMRHNAASNMLRHGIPLSIISAALGHAKPDSTNIYLTTDEVKLAECTLPLPIFTDQGVRV